MPALRDARLLILSLAAFAFARIAGGTLPWFLFYATFGLVAVAALWAWQLRRSLHCLVALDRTELEVGQELRVKVRVENEGLLPLPWAEVENGTPDRLAHDPMPLVAVSMGVLGSRIAEFRMRARRRGHYPVGPIRIIAGDGMGIFELRRQVTSQHLITVFPRVVSLQAVPIPLGQPFGHVRTRQRAFADPSSLAEIRPYRPGDNPRHIHWATSARRGALHLKEYELNATTQLALFVDMEAAAHAGGPDGDAAEKAVETAAALANLALRQGLEMSLWAVGAERRHVPVGHGHRTFRQCLEVLARAEADGSLPIDRVLRTEAASLPSRSTLAVITPALTPALADTLIRLHPKHPIMLVALKAETFTGEEPGAAARDRDKLCALLALNRIAVYPLGAADDLRRLADLRLRAAAAPALAAVPTPAVTETAAGEVAP